MTPREFTALFSHVEKRISDLSGTELRPENFIATVKELVSSEQLPRQAEEELRTLWSYRNMLHSSAGPAETVPEDAGNRFAKLTLFLS